MPNYFLFLKLSLWTNIFSISLSLITGKGQKKVCRKINLILYFCTIRIFYILSIYAVLILVRWISRHVIISIYLSWKGTKKTISTMPGFEPKFSSSFPLSTHFPHLFARSTETQGMPLTKERDILFRSPFHPILIISKCFIFLPYQLNKFKNYYLVEWD